MSAPKLPAHGTSARYRRELKERKVCEKCKTAESRRRKARRDDATRRAIHPRLHLVGDGQSDGHADTVADTDENLSLPDDAGADAPRPKGAMELAIEQDIAELNSAVPFHRSLETMALSLARDMDSLDTKASKSAYAKQLYEVLKSLRGEDTGDGDEDRIKAFIAEISVPVVPGM